MSQPTTDLAVRRRRGWGIVSVLIAVLGAVGLIVWYAQHPTPLPTEDRTVAASTPVGEPVYVGVANGLEGRTLNLSGVKVHTTSNTDVSVTPLLCRDGRLEATTDPTAFCDDLVNPEGQSFDASDSIVLKVVSPEPAIAVVDPVRLGFREGLQAGTFPTGAGAIVRVLSR
ncbi:MAG: hypothetical protein OSB43_03940 [Nocardioides sp.]|uniref:hypothetical protein n=1 Tax=Nocardioides sp. TaxID=35761 RepID=UPI0023980803|nr:hypothetical protein [Nocardioides sp.]MDE0775413.1 hypothetical protein [Nocardioides sp.]